MKKKNKYKEIQAEQYEENDSYEEDTSMDDNYEEEIDSPDYEDSNYEESTDEEFEDADSEDESLEEDTYVEPATEEYEDANKTFNRTNNKFSKVLNIIFFILILAMILISVDVICISKYDVGPFFAIKTKTYTDGGTKEYYGLGYKVIKYNVTEGRKGTQVGSWALTYNITPTTIDDIDLSIEFLNNPEKTANKYYNQYLQISSIVKEIKVDKNELVLGYTDPDEKYTLEIRCAMSDDGTSITTYQEKQELLVRGTAYKFAIKDEAQPNTIYLSNCYAE